MGKKITVGGLGEITTVLEQDASETPNTPAGNVAATDVQAAINELDTEKQAISEKAQPNGYPSLDSNGKIPSAQLAVTSLTYKGTWNASTNTPTLSDVTGSSSELYRVTAAGTQDLGSGNIVFSLGDKVVFNGTVWEKWDHVDAVDSVNGQTGVVNLGATNISYDNATSGLTATTSQAAIDEIDNTIDSLNAGTLSYDNTNSNLVATDVQSAIDETEGRVDNLEASKNSLTNLCEGGTWSAVINNGTSTLASSSGGVDIVTSVFSNSSYRGQEFIATSTDNISEVDLELSVTAAGASGSLFIKVYDKVGADPGTLLGTSDALDVTTISTSSSTKTFTFSSPVSLINSNSYYIILTGDAIIFSSQSILSHGFNTAGPYTGGTVKSSNDSGATWVADEVARDLNFQVRAINNVNDITLTSNAYVPQAGLQKDRNTISPQTINLGTNDIAYVSVNKLINVQTTLPVNVTTFAAYSPSSNDIIICKKTLDGVEIGDKLFLQNGDSSSIEKGLIPALPILKDISEGGNWSSATVASQSSSTNNLGGTAFVDLSNTTLQFRGQEFIPTITGSIAEVDLWVAKTNLASTGNLTVRIYDKATGEPNAVLVTSDPLNSSVLTSSFAKITFTFSTPLTINSGTSYYAILVTDALTFNGDGIKLQGTGAGDIYPNGNRVATNDSGATWIIGTPIKDLNFDIKVSVSSETLTLSSDAYLKQPGFVKTRNTIVAQTINFGSDEIAFVTVNTDSDVSTTLPVQTSSIVNFAPSDKTIIIARVTDGGIKVGEKLFLKDGESSSINTGIFPIVLPTPEYVETIYQDSSLDIDSTVTPVSPGPTSFFVNLTPGTWDIGYSIDVAQQFLVGGTGGEVFFSCALYDGLVVISGTERYTLQRVFSNSGDSIKNLSARTQLIISTNKIIEFKCLGQRALNRNRMITLNWTATLAGVDSSPMIWARRIK